MIVPVVQHGDLADGLEFRLPDLPSAQSVTYFVPMVARAPTGTCTLRIKNAPGVAGEYIEATIPAGQTYGSVASGSFSATELYCEVVSAGGAGFLRGYGVTSTVGSTDLLPINVPGLLISGTQVPFAVPHASPTFDRFQAIVRDAPTAETMFRLKREQGSTLPSEWLESTVAAGATVGSVSTGSITPPANGTLWMEVVGGSGDAAWLNGAVRVTPTGYIGDLYTVPLIWPGQLASGDSFLVRSPPFSTNLRHFRASFQNAATVSGIVLTAELEGQGQATLQLNLADHQSFGSQTGLSLAIPGSSLVRVRMVSAAQPGNWLTGVLYFEALPTTEFGLKGRIRVRPALKHDGIRVAASQWVGR